MSSKYKRKYAQYLEMGMKKKKKKKKYSKPNYKAPDITMFPISDCHIDQFCVDTIYKRYHGFRFKIYITKEMIYGFRSVYVYKDYVAQNNLNGVLYDPRLYDNVNDLYNKHFNSTYVADSWKEAIIAYNEKKSSK